MADTGRGRIKTRTMRIRRKLRPGFKLRAAHEVAAWKRMRGKCVRVFVPRVTVNGYRGGCDCRLVWRVHPDDVVANALPAAQRKVALGTHEFGPRFICQCAVEPVRSVSRG